MTAATYELLIRDAASVLTMEEDSEGGVLGVLPESSVAIRDGLIGWIGPTEEAPSATRTVDAAGALVMPGLVECHTHSVWAGTRASEFRRRLSGVPYTTILEEGGGILSTVDATRAADEATLVSLAAQRLKRLASRGVTTVEIKSGYGLSPEHELRMLRTVRDGMHTTMWQHAGIVRSSRGLASAMEELNALSLNLSGAFTGGEHSLEALEVENLLTVAQLVLACAARRKESRGLHFTRDYVHATDSEKRDTVLSSSDVDLQLTRAMPELVSR